MTPYTPLLTFAACVLWFLHGILILGWRIRDCWLDGNVEMPMDPCIGLAIAPFVVDSVTVAVGIFDLRIVLLIGACLTAVVELMIILNILAEGVSWNPRVTFMMSSLTMNVVAAALVWRGEKA